MDIRRLEVFCKVVELKSFTKAAEEVLLSQPTVSENIRLLEDLVGEKLLDRLGREVLPTGAGKLLYRYARRLIQLRDETLQAMEEYRGRLSGTLALGASTIPGAYILPRLIESFKKQHANIPITLKISGTSEIVDDLLSGGLEMGIIGARWKDQSLECEEIFSDELILTLWPGHPWSGKQDIRLEDLLGQPFILRERGSGTRMVMNQVFKEHGLDPSRLTVVAEMGSTEAVRQGIKAGMGISILSQRAVEEDVARGTLTTLPVEGVRMVRPFYLVQRKSRQLSPLGQAFYAHLEAAAGISGKAAAGG